MLSVEVTTLITNHTLLVGVGVDDTSHAPAQQLYMSLVGLTETIVNFTSEGLSLPVRHAYIQVLDVPLSDLYSGNYTVRARGSNVLGNQTRYIEQKVFVNGGCGYMWLLMFMWIYMSYRIAGNFRQPKNLYFKITRDLILVLRRKLRT